MTATCPQGHTSASTDYCDTCGAPIATAAPATSAPGASGAVKGKGSKAAKGGKRTGPAAGSAGAPPAALDAGPAARTCPNCQASNPDDALFCEACGYDFTTGALPRGAAPAAAAQAPAAPGSSLDLDAPPPAAGPDASAVTPTPSSGVAPDPDPAPLAPAVPLEWVAEIWVDPQWYAEQQIDEPCPTPGPPVLVPLTVRSLLVGRTSQSRNIHPEIDCGADVGVSRRQAQLTTDGTRWWVEDLQSSNGTYVGPAEGPLPEQPLVPGQRREVGEGDRIYVGAWTRLVVRRATAEEAVAG